jgi:hypothetical protein
VETSLGLLICRGSQFPFWGLKDMKKLVFLVGGAAALALAGCNNGNQDAVNNVELNQPAPDDLNALANDAAANAEDQALGNQQQQLNDENAVAPSNGSNPSEAEEQNVDAM